ncbi:KRE1 domain-containing protein [Acetobacter pasteurianus]|uniref:Protein KRE1 n=1 Tax=Lodderomyces elongisporus (strain ATCC 11503 / CBS 2605 / JCM 1781 / NBRC 1676 / NRRL YB-4239) TaxID=379508 RepID=A5E6M6_LODEL|nr:hypothetical protein LELG_05265 [Lodderomyces elongisporus NRRL YB-4239]MDC6270717.1 KRE1 domain-containing protein [Acetobacter pasteurianus]
MIFGKLLSCIFFLFASVYGLADQGDGAGAKTSEQTIVWITTTVKGELTTMSTLFSQSFLSINTDAAGQSIASGEIGMGTISGSVGGHRSYDHTTISQGNAGAGSSGNNVYAGVAGAVYVLLGLI